MENINLIPDQSGLISDELKSQIKALLANMNKKVVLKSILDIKDSKSLEMGAFLKEIASCSEWFELEFYERGENPVLDSELDAEHLPVAGVYRDGYAGASFHGTPGGQEINAFLAVICTYGGGTKPMERRLAKRIASIDRHIDIKVFVSLACHYCPHTVAACMKVALASEYINAAMYDANLYPDLVQTYNLDRIPMVIINEDAVVFGKKSMDDILDKIKLIN